MLGRNQTPASTGFPGEADELGSVRTQGPPEQERLADRELHILGLWGLRELLFWSRTWRQSEVRSPTGRTSPPDH